MSFNFNAVEEKEQVKLPEMLEKDVFKNQTTIIDPLRVKEIVSLVIGAGSVGSNLVHTMNKFGFSAFVVYDYDVWEHHNSASSIYPYKRAKIELERSNRTYQDWTYFPSMPKNPTSMPSHSAFKVDLLHTEINRNDEQLYFEKYRVPFGMKMVDAFTKFNESLAKMNAKAIFNAETGLIRGGRGTQYEFYWYPQVQPDILLLTTDNLRSRYRSVMWLRKLVKEGVYEYEDNFLPVIDTRTLDTTKGEILIFNALDDQEVFDWFNYSIPVRARTETFEELNEQIETDIDNIDQIEFISEGTNLCGNKMSVLISEQISILTTSIITEIFKEGSEWEKIPKLYLMNTSATFPFVSKMDKLLNE